MRIITDASIEAWTKLIQRPEFEKDELNEKVNTILLEVKKNGDKALLGYAEKFDKVKLQDLEVGSMECKNATVSQELKEAIQLAKSNIEKFHQNQLIQEKEIETTEGVRCWRKNVAIEKVGLYIPGGSAPLFSTILMLGIPAKLVGCKEVILCTPPNSDGEVHPAILYTANLLGIEKIYKVGGAQAIAAMTFGTETIPQVNKIFGPGNQYVTQAKALAQLSGAAIDMPAGPSEVLIIADKECNPAFVAADLLSQAEHGSDSQVVLLAINKELAETIVAEIEKQLLQLPRKDIAEKALENSFALVLNSLEQCMKFSNAYAPEHLILNTRVNNKLAEKVLNAGSVFIGPYSCESAGDYASGTNHTLPTNGYARAYSGVSVDSFIKKISFQEITAQGIKNIGPAIEIMAEAEELFAHKNAVSLRLKMLQDG